MFLFMKKFFNEFKTFIARGNVIDMAVGIIVGSAFTAIVNSLVKDVITPFISTIIYFIFGGKFNFASLNWNCGLVNEKGEAIMYNFGTFIEAIITFIIIAFVVFCMVKIINSLHKKKEEAPAAPPAPSEEVLLLREIRDSLKK